MKLTERVLRHLEETRGEWILADSGKSLRTVGTRKCPLESVRGWPTNEVIRRRSARNSRRRWFRGIRQAEKKIIDASDRGYLHDPALRARMLEAAGLTEPEEA